jgi:hypothetical protein
METYRISVKELKNLINESASEFKAKLGPNVEADNKKNNEKSYKDSEKRAKDYDGGLAKEEKKNLPEKGDYNRTTLDYNPISEPDKATKDRIEAQAEGYSSKLEKDNDIEKVGNFDGNKKIAKQFKDQAEKISDERAELAHTGLQARMMDKDKFKKNTMLESKPGAKRLRFKHTKFMNESQVLTRIPEQYKVDGQVIYMCDKADNEYIVECVRSERSGLIETNIVSYGNKTAMNEQMNRIQELMGFKTNTNDRYNQINENKEFGKILDTTRNKTTID